MLRQCVSGAQTAATILVVPSMSVLQVGVRIEPMTLCARMTASLARLSGVLLRWGVRVFRTVRGVQRIKFVAKRAEHLRVVSCLSVHEKETLAATTAKSAPPSAAMSRAFGVCMSPATQLAMMDGFATVLSGASHFGAVPWALDPRATTTRVVRAIAAMR